MGAQIPGAGGFSSLYFAGKNMTFGAVAADITDSQFEAAMGAATISSRGLQKALGGHLWEAKGTTTTAAPDQIGSNNETLSERRDSAGATVTLPAVSASGWTPNASPYGLWYFKLTDTGQTTPVQYGSWQSTAAFAVTGLDLDTDYSFLPRTRDSGGTLSNFGPPAHLAVDSPNDTGGGTGSGPVDLTDLQGVTQDGYAVLMSAPLAEFTAEGGTGVGIYIAGPGEDFPGSPDYTVPYTPVGGRAVFYAPLPDLNRGWWTALSRRSCSGAARATRRRSSSGSTRRPRSFIAGRLRTRRR
jgi:hypothetical protein